MKRINADGVNGNGPGPMDAPAGTEFVGLEQLDPEADDNEVQDAAGSEPEMDSPGDNAVLDQEELYEGISSERMPSEKER